MTYHSQKTAPYDKSSSGFQAQIRDKITNVSGYSVAHDYLDTQDPNGEEGYMVLDTPLNMQIAFGFRGGNYNFTEISYDFGFAVGRLWDDTITDWGGEQLKRWDSADMETNNGISSGETVEYWLEVVPRGIVLAAQRSESDGDDGSLFVAWEEVDKLWDFTNANNPETEARWSMQRGDGLDRSGKYNFQKLYDSKQNGGAKLRGRGLLNPDTNFANYPWVETLHHCDAYQNTGTNERAIIGTTDLLLFDYSDVDTTTGDVIEDGSGTPIYEVVKMVRQIEPILIRMD